jgi:hypothetical protein
MNQYSDLVLVAKQRSPDGDDSQRIRSIYTALSPLGCSPPNCSTQQLPFTPDLRTHRFFGLVAVPATKLPVDLMTNKQRIRPGPWSAIV